MPVIRVTPAVAEPGTTATPTCSTNSWGDPPADRVDARSRRLSENRHERPVAIRFRHQFLYYATANLSQANKQHQEDDEDRQDYCPIQPFLKPSRALRYLNQSVFECGGFLRQQRLEVV
jgi:hypothetical protein